MRPNDNDEAIPMILFCSSYFAEYSSKQGRIESMADLHFEQQVVLARNLLKIESIKRAEESEMADKTWRKSKRFQPAMVPVSEVYEPAILFGS
jgi:hypothetical protein